MKTISKFGDRLLARALGSGTAGACVPEVSQPCSYWKSDGHCSGGVWWQTLCSGRYACNGTCTSGTTCILKKLGTC